MPMIQRHLRDGRSDGIADKDSAAQPPAWRSTCSHCLTDKASAYQNGIGFFLHASLCSAASGWPGARPRSCART